LKIKILSLFIFFSVFTNAQGIWVQKASMVTARYDAIHFVIGGKGYVGLGNNSWPSPSLNDLWEYDPATDSWAQMANFPGDTRELPISFSIGNSGYIGTGMDHGISSLINDFWEWNQTTNTWFQKNNFPGSPRAWSFGFSIGSKGYICTDPQNSIHDLWEYDPANDSWIQKAGFPGHGNGGVTGFAIGTKAYIGTGVDSLGPTQDFWSWDQTSNTWTQIANFPGSKRAEATGFSIGDFGYVGLGTDTIGSGARSNFWKYNPQTNCWLQIADFGGGKREIPISFTIGCKAYVGCGWINDANYQNDLWEYTPDTCYLNGVYEMNISNLVSIYPNPTKGKINIVFQKQNLHIEQIEIYDLKGEQKLISNINQKNLLDLSSLKNGVYFAHVQTVEGTAVKKIVVER
jgi:N-acetylneuraminic acid mutarotase